MPKRKTTRVIDMRTLCLTHNPSMYSERTPQYRFSNGREFTKAPGDEYSTYSAVTMDGETVTLNGEEVTW